MSPTRRSSIAAAALASLAALFLAVLPHDVAAAGKPGTTKLSIHTAPKPYGYVKSSRPKECASGREIALFAPRSGRDERVATVTSYRYHGDYQWQAEPASEPRLYARASRTPACDAARSEGAAVEPPGAGTGSAWGTCPDPQPKTFECILPQIHLDSDWCPSFRSAHGDCNGNTWLKRLTADDDLLWQTCCFHANFHWNGDYDGFRGAALYVNDDKGDHSLRGYLEGSVPSANSDRFTIRDAWSIRDPGRHWCTPDIAGKAAGTDGAPLKLNFVNGTFGADVYIEGWLYLKGHGC